METYPIFTMGKTRIAKIGYCGGHFGAAEQLIGGSKMATGSPEMAAGSCFRTLPSLSEGAKMAAGKGNPR